MAAIDGEGDVEIAPKTAADQPSNEKVNINMLAAFSHLSADSMRTLSIFIAAIIAVAGWYSATCL